MLTLLCVYVSARACVCRSWFNTWDITKYNITTQQVHSVYNDPDVLTLDELPDWRAPGAR